MKTVWKYAVPIQDAFTLTLPEDAEVLTVQQQGPHTQLWAEVDTDAPPVPRHFHLVGTGNPMPPLTNDEWRMYIGTFQLGYLVFHLFEVCVRAAA